MGSRRKGRELALQMLYQWDLRRQPLDEVFESMAELESFDEDELGFARRIVEGTVRRVEEIDALLAEHSERWRLSRMPAVDRSILRLAAYECMEMETPKKVVINEALQIAKRFSSPDAVQFINGVLDAVRVRIEATSESR